MIGSDILIAPDILSNVGGVTISHFAWTQNAQLFRWDEDRVNQKLSKVTRKTYRAVRDVPTEFDADMHTAALALAIRQVAKAALARVNIDAPPPF